LLSAGAKNFAHPKPYDPDNAIGCLKPVLDAMRKVGWIRDDSETWLELLPVRQERSAAGAPATMIEIEALPSSEEFD
jgi:hypothetical protein